MRDTVENEKSKVLIVYEDGKNGLEAVAKEIKKALGTRATVKVRAASDLAVAEILAADAYAFGVVDADAHAWAETRRLLQGMNLAGRKAAFFSTKADGARKLRAAFVPAELTVLSPDYVVADSAGACAWAEALVAKQP